MGTHGARGRIRGCYQRCLVALSTKNNLGNDPGRFRDTGKLYRAEVSDGLFSGGVKRGVEDTFPTGWKRYARQRVKKGVFCAVTNDSKGTASFLRA